MAEKIRAAAAARQDPDFLIIARTDARTTLGVEEAIRRARLYAEAGADLLFVESLESAEEMREVNRRLPLPTVANMVEGGRSPALTAEELRERFPERKLCCVDSRSAAGGQGLFAVQAAVNRDKGMSIEDNARWLEEHAMQVCHWFIVDDLDFLKRGGRVSPTVAFLGASPLHDQGPASPEGL